MDLKGLVKALGYRYKDIQNQSQVQNEAMDALIQIDEPAVDLLIRTLNNEFIGPSDSDIQMRIVRILGEIGTKKAVNVLIEVLDGDIKDIRYEIAMDRLCKGNEEETKRILQKLEIDMEDLQIFLEDYMQIYYQEVLGIRQC